MGGGDIDPDQVYFAVPSRVDTLLVDLYSARDIADSEGGCLGRRIPDDKVDVLVFDRPVDLDPDRRLVFRSRLPAILEEHGGGHITPYREFIGEEDEDAPART